MTDLKNKKTFRDLIETLVNSVEIEEVANRLAIPVKKSGAHTLAKCIFHNDTDPSMVLYKGSATHKPHFHCYVCNEHGDIFDLVKKHEGLDFIQSVKWLAGSFNLGNPTHVSRVTKPLIKLEAAKSLEQTNVNTAQLVLDIYSEQNLEVVNEWLNSREINESIVLNAELKFAKPRTLVNHLSKYGNEFGKQRETIGILIDGGFIRPLANARQDPTESNFLNLTNHYRDFFDDGRLIFPIRSADGSLEGFAGRKINDASTAPKYLYSPHLQKSKVLYRANVAFVKLKRDFLLGTAPILYLCEGLFDALRLESFGIAAVAVLGSKLSDAQAELVLNLASDFPEKNPLQIRFFFDKDAAGLKGAASSIEALIKLDQEIHTQISFVWPSRLADEREKMLKDPDEILKGISDTQQVLDLLEVSQYPAALALLSNQLRVWPEEILDDHKWDEIPLGAKYRLSLHLRRSSNGLVDRVLEQVSDNRNELGKWLVDVKRFIDSPPLRMSGDSSKNSPEQISLQLNLARDLAQSGAIQGEVLADIAAWRRISLAATAFNEGFKSRLKQPQFQPTEPYDAIFVSRGFGKLEERLKAMPCPEDLVIQQYLLNEILGENNDNGTGNQFSNHIPAVRFYRTLGISRTTGEGGVGELDDPLSFAYQIDMDVLEGRSPSGESGFFRPYFECWKEFISSLLKQGKHMENVHMVRLDFKRYYDRISRKIVRDVLRKVIGAAYDSLDDEGKKSFAPLFQPKNLEHERHNAAVDLFLEHSFGFPYSHPKTGAYTTTDREMGIPQGPVLSAWLGNVVLFKLDAVMRSKLNELNRDGVCRVGYARYVDDVVLIGESSELLSLLRATAEDVARSLSLVLIAKESFAPMTSAQFLEHLTAGRALTASGPREEAVLLESGDGDAGWSMWQTDKQERQSSLELLRDPRLYAMPPGTIQNQVFTALRATDLRPAELSKASRWLWYQSARSLVDSEYNELLVIEAYWDAWHKSTAGITYFFDEKAPWDDPAFYALEGLESLFERANTQIYGLNPEEENERIRCIAKLATVAKSPKFSELFFDGSSLKAPIGWSIGVNSLPRMFYRRLIGLRWKAARLAPDRAQLDGNEIDVQENTVLQWIKSQSDVLQASLRRSLTTDAETWKIQSTPVAATGRNESEENVLHDAFLWLHDAVVSLSVSSHNEDDPINYLRSALEEIIQREKSINLEHFKVPEDIFIPLLLELLPSTDSLQTKVAESGGTILLALQTLAAIAPRECLASLLSKRWHLLQTGGIKIPLPPLPGLPSDGLLLVSAQEGESDYTVLQTIWWATVTEQGDLGSILPSFHAVVAGGAPSKVNLQWQLSEAIGGLSLYYAEWPSSVGHMEVFRLPPALNIYPSSLGWVADIFETIAKINDQLESPTAVPLEYAPAWPFLASSMWPTSNVQSPLSVALLSLSYPADLLDGQAFIRDGLRGLQSYEISELYGKFWRIGVMLSDVFGFARDLDQYAALKVDDQSEAGMMGATEPASHLLRNVLSKLRGKYFNEKVLRPQPGREYLPATISRSLTILRMYPTDGCIENEIAYVLASETETVAMQIRLATSGVNCQGLSASFLERVALKVINRIPLGWSEHLRSSPNTKLPKLRALPKAYLDLADRLDALVQPNAIKESVPNYLALISGLRIAGIAAAIRELVFISEVIGNDKNWSFAIDGDLTMAWGLDESGFLFSKPECSLKALRETFQTLIHDNAPQQAFSDITPFGWLALLAGKVGLIGLGAGSQFSNPWSETELKNVCIFANSLAKSAFLEPTDEIHPDWPFELHNPDTLNEWQARESLEYIDCLFAVEKKIGLHYSGASVGNWRFDLSDNSFTDTKSIRWQFQRWQIALSGGTKPYRKNVGRQLLSAWDETRDSEGNLVFVSALNEKLAKLTGDISLHDQTVGRESNSQKNSSAELIHSPASKEPIISVPVRLVETDLTIESSAAQTSKKMNLDEGSSIRADFDSVMLQWRSLQDFSWVRRKHRSSGHIRVALMQWNLAETYHHPIIDKLDWNSKWPTKESESFVDSKTESRRRLFITEALSSCERFGVDLLVLPEYSVRPDTIKWLREQLVKHAYKVSVLAGTYKLHGNIFDSGFKETFAEILGVSDQNTILANASTKDRHLYSSGEHSSILTLLAPLSLNTGEKLVCTFTRRKKYPSLAAAEIFNPLLGTLDPLYSVEGLISELKSRSKENKRTVIGEGIDLKAEAIIEYNRDLRHLECLTEFICSELFLPMSPVNHSALASELHKLAVRFGSSISEEDVQTSVLSDLKNMGDYMGMANSRGVKRRSIFVVPAMTTRSADYWIFGQAALLAGGATTVFCNAVEGKYSVGGSCFVGRNSWSKESVSVHCDTVTPYAGWSKGVFYNKPSDALGKKEQAVVIADVDPTFMQEGKPRPQALAIPLQLVAYLPIVEISDSKDAEKANEIAINIQKILSVSSQAELISATTQEFLNVQTLVTDILKDCDEGAFAKRFDHWKAYGRANPIAGVPPALIDWLWVNTSENNLEKVFVPKCRLDEDTSGVLPEE